MFSRYEPAPERECTAMRSAPTLADAVTNGAIRTPDQRLRVFVSSTLGELAEERRAARSAVEQLRLTPVMFELGARAHPPRALYRSYLEQSDVFVGIYWQRYGWTAPDMEISGLEDEYVLSKGMPRLVYVKQPAPDIEPGLAAMVAHLESESTTSYRIFETAEELHDLLMDDLAILLTERFDDDAVGVPPAHPLPRHNLPSQASTFLGREAELRDLRELIRAPEVRLITLTGPAGSGKTRLGIQVAAEEVPRFADGVFFVDLSAEREAEGAFGALARVVGVSVGSDARPVDALKGELRHRRTLLLLDNFEQAMPAAVGVVQLLEHCPDVKVLVTSREALRLRGERVFAVPPLSLPGADARGAGASEAVQLFCDRAAAVAPGFHLAEENAEAITAICRRVDGLPLAIELAAARMRLFDVASLRARLEHRLDLLGGGARDLPERQQTLRDAIGWSYDLLTDGERRMFSLFAVFSGARLTDFEETAARVSNLDHVDVIEAIGSLVDKSLVRSSLGSDGRPRFSMLHTIRAFANEKLDAIPDFASEARLAHASQYSEVALGLRHQLTSAPRGDVLAALADELGNLRKAWDEWVERKDVARLNDLLAPLWGYYDARGDYRSAIELGNGLLECLAATPESPERRRDEFAVGMSVVRTKLALQGFTAAAEHMVREVLERTEAAGDGRQRFPGLRSLGYLQMMRSDFEQTEAIARELMAIAEAEQDPLLLAEAHMLTGLSRAWRVDLPGSIEHYDKAVEYAEATRSGYVDFRVGTHPAVVANVVSGLTRWTVGFPEAASAALERALGLAADLDHPYSMAYALHHAGLLDLWRQDMASVAARASALEAIAETHQYPMWRALSLVLGGVAKVGSGDVQTGMARLDEGFKLYQGLSTPPVFWPALLMIRANALCMAGRHDEALTLIQEAELALKPGDPMAPDVRLAHGDILLAGSPPDRAAAEAMFERVAKFAAGLGARMAELQALTRLATLRRGAPGEAETLSALREVYERFNEGLHSPHLVAARAALDAQEAAGQPG